MNNARRQRIEIDTLFSRYIIVQVLHRTTDRDHCFRGCKHVAEQGLVTCCQRRPKIKSNKNPQRTKYLVRVLALSRERGMIRESEYETLHSRQDRISFQRTDLLVPNRHYIQHRCLYLNSYVSCYTRHIVSLKYKIPLSDAD